MVGSEELKEDLEISNSNINPAPPIIVEAGRSEQTDDFDLLTREVAKGGSVAFIGNTVVRFVTFGLHVLLGRVLGPATYGLYALGRSVNVIAESLASLGLSQGIVRYCSMYRGEGDKARVKGMIISSLYMSLVSSIPVVLLLFLFGSAISKRFFNEPDLTNVIKVFALALPFCIFITMTIAFAQSFKRIEYQQGVKILLSLVRLGAIGLSFLFGFRLGGATFGFLVSAALGAGMGFYSLWRIFPEIRSAIVPLYQIKKLIRFSLPVSFVSVLYILMNYTDRIMLGLFGAASGVGIYNAASTVSLQMAVFLSAFIAIFSPIISDLHNQGKKVELSNIFKLVTRWVTVLTLPVFFLLTLCAADIMQIFGSGFAEGETVLVILSVSQLVNIGTGPVGILLRMTGKQDLEFFNGLILLMINISLNAWLIPIYGLVGAALGTAISIVLIHLARLLEVYSIFRISPYNRRYFPILLVGLASGMTGLALKTVAPEHLLWHIVGGVVTVFIYVGVLYVSCLEQEDRYILDILRNKLCPRRS